jgi:hypothetical protein
VAYVVGKVVQEAGIVRRADPQGHHREGRAETAQLRPGRGRQQQRQPGQERHSQATPSHGPARHSLGQRGLNLLHHGGECGRVVEGEGGEHLAVHLDTGLVQTVDKSAVGDPVLAHRRIDALDP